MKIDLVVAGNLAEDVIFGESHYGGSAGNIALNARVLGLETGIISNYGQDYFSRQYLDYLAERGVRTDLLQPGLENIAQCIVTSSANHSTSKEWRDNGTSEALKRFAPEEHQRAIIAQSRFLHLTTTPSSLARTLSAIERPQGLLGYEPGPRIGEDDSYFDETVFQKSDILFVNEEELLILRSMIGAVALRKMLSDDQMIVATRGKDGTELITRFNQQFYRAESVPNRRIVDSNGAGDAFKSGFYAGLANTRNIGEAIRCGNKLGALIVQKRGDLLDTRDMVTLNSLGSSDAPQR